MTGKPGAIARSRARAATPRLAGIGAALRLLFRSRNFQEVPRLLREGSAPVVRLLIQMHNTSEIMRLLQKGRQVIFVSSFPRSGNTWVRYLLADVFLQSQGVETTTELPVHPDKIVPDFYCHWIARRDLNVPVPGVFVKIHDAFDRLEERFGGATPSSGAGGAAGVSPFRNCKHLYLYRSPEDTLVSFYHYHAERKHLKSKAGGGIDAFCLAHLPAWEENMASYLRAADEGIPVLFVPYELLLQYPGEILSNLLRWLGARHDGATVERAISNMQFNKLQAIEAREAFHEEALSFRRGRRGSGQTELQAATLAEIQNRTAHLLEQAHSRAMMQQALERNPASSKTGRIRMAAALQNKQFKPLHPLPKLQRM